MAGSHLSLAEAISLTSSTFPTLSLAKCIKTNALEKTQVALVTQCLGQEEVPIRFQVWKISPFKIYGLVPIQPTLEDYKRQNKIAENQFNAHAWLIIKKNGLETLEAMEALRKWVRKNYKIRIVAPKALQAACELIQRSYSGAILDEIDCYEDCEDTAPEELMETIPLKAQTSSLQTNLPSTPSPSPSSPFSSNELDTYFTQSTSSSWCAAVGQLLSWIGDGIPYIFNKLASCLCNSSQTPLQERSRNNKPPSPSQEDARKSEALIIKSRGKKQKKKKKQPPFTSSSRSISEDMIFYCSPPNGDDNKNIVKKGRESSESNIEKSPKKNGKLSSSPSSYTPSSRSPYWNLQCVKLPFSREGISIPPSSGSLSKSHSSLS